MRNYVRAVFALSAFCLSFGLAEAENKTFENPMFGTNRLDWCADWGKGCGAEAATACARAMRMIVPLVSNRPLISELQRRPS
jgi:hypothetical protein